ncbi:flagellar protein FlgN [Anoxybacillus rupiensis]|jgi:flagellar biosynthesis/type III secretory pathway chaperone|uniref:Flagellar protein FlgN n=1 Tax=Anoxybacteroides rupiense TaxID=311460 RepID=A0ABT5W584_9BACL|nr:MULTISPECIES: flagellar protein FlgN [Anoxybacillus]KXG08997.1 hypothetical protein AT864_02681 [Anoxybacillus sp. P3H1B]MBS2771202.1 flagellar protein FlgN [Anoxybacillus rupiensis]MDE8564486.1 flagellar protein FlgN [Anoxybacillus rupiensis]
MSAAPLIHLLEEYVELHKHLLHSAHKKTDVLKKGDMEALKTIIQDEQKHIFLISQLEKKRSDVIAALFPRSSTAEEPPTLAACIERAAEPERSELKKRQEELSKAVRELKEANELNQQLVQQSLQFVHMTLDLLLPQTPEINYQNPHSAASGYESGRSLFDSKA